MDGARSNEFEQEEAEGKHQDDLRGASGRRPSHEVETDDTYEREDADRKEADELQDSLRDRQAPPNNTGDETMRDEMPEVLDNSNTPQQKLTQAIIASNSDRTATVSFLSKVRQLFAALVDSITSKLPGVFRDLAKWVMGVWRRKG